MYFRICDLFEPDVRIGPHGSGTAECLNVSHGDSFHVYKHPNTIYICEIAGDYWTAIVEEILLSKPVSKIYIAHAEWSGR